MIRSFFFAIIAVSVLSGTLLGQIQIGAVYCDGDQKVLDEPSAIGARLAVEQANRAGGIGGQQIKLIYLIANPQPILNELAAFLSEKFLPSPKVEACIKPELHRNRAPSPG